VSEVLPLLVQEYPAMTYHVVGDGPQRDRIERTIVQHGLSHVVQMHGALPDKQRDEVTCASDLCVVPNVRVPGDMEGFGIVCLEAAVRGVPVAAADLEGLHDAVMPGETGLLYRAGDPMACAQAVRHMLQHRLKREDVVQATLDAFGWDHVFDRMLNDVFCS
jgi:glycosyltransferase involved in cell wall biosynthesis